MKIVSLVVLLTPGMLLATVCGSFRMGKKDRDDIQVLVSEPMRKIEQKIDSINQAAQSIQNFIVDNYNQGADQELREQYVQILNKINHLSLLVEALAYVVQAQSQQIVELTNHVADLEDVVVNLELNVAQVQNQVSDVQTVVGSLSDVSVGEEDFNTVEDIDRAELTLVSWGKTEYREQLHDKFIS